MLLALPAVAAWQPAAAQQRVAGDRFGYSLQSGEDCPRQWLDTGDEQVLTLAAAGPDFEAGDDGGAEFALDWAFEFYNRLHRHAVVSSNGYLAFAGGLEQENGGDWNNDCPLPAVPENNATALGRIAVLHDDLSGADGRISAESYTDCPRPSRYPNDACAVVTWENWGLTGGQASGFDFQVVLYRRSRDVVLQYRDPLPPTASATIGLQQQDLRTGLNAGCDSAEVLPAGGALCLLHPLPPDTLFRDGLEDGPVPAANTGLAQ